MLCVCLSNVSFLFSVYTRIYIPGTRYCVLAKQENISLTAVFRRFGSGFRPPSYVLLLVVHMYQVIQYYTQLPRATGQVNTLAVVSTLLDAGAIILLVLFGITSTTAVLMYLILCTWWYVVLLKQAHYLVLFNTNGYSSYNRQSHVFATEPGYWIPSFVPLLQQY